MLRPALLLLCLSLSAWAADGPLATVNGAVIDPVFVQQRAARMAPADGKALSLEERQEALDTVLEEELLYQEALREGYDQDPKVQKVMVNTLLRNEVYGEVRNSDFTDEDLQAYFEAHRDEFVVPEKVQIKMVFVSSAERGDAAAKKRAQQAQALIAADPARFKEIASEYDEGPYRKRGGDAGFVTVEGKPGLEPAVVEIAFTLVEGAISPALPVTGGWAVVYVPLRRAEVVRTYQQMKGSVLRQAKNERLAEMYDAYVADLAANSVILVDRAWWKAHPEEKLPWPVRAQRKLGHVATLDGVPIELEERDDGLESLEEAIAQALLYRAALAAGLDTDPKVKKVMVNSLLREEVYSQVQNEDFSDEELQAYYEAHLQEFVVPEKVQIKRILIRVDEGRSAEEARALAEELRLEILGNPQAFKELATEHSECPYRRRGGDLGFVSREGKPGVDPLVVEVAFSLETGRVSEVFETADGFHLVYVANRRDRVERTYQQMKGSVLRKVKNDALKLLYEAYVAELRADAAITVDLEALENLEIRAVSRPVLEVDP